VAGPDFRAGFRGSVLLFSWILAVTGSRDTERARASASLASRRNASCVPKSHVLLKRAELLDLLLDIEPKERSLGHAASLALPHLR